MSITRVQNLSTISGTSTPAFTSFALGDVIVVFGNYFPTAGSPACHDSLGNIYSIVHNSGALYAAGPEIIFKTVVTVAGASPIVTISGSGASRLGVAQYRGFTGTPTFLTATDFAEATGTGTAVSTTPFNVSHTGELLVGEFSDTGAHVVPAQSHVTLFEGNFQLAMFDSTTIHPTGVTAGTAVSWSGTLTGSDTWYASLIGIYDAPATGAIKGTAALAVGASGAIKGKGSLAGTAAMAIGSSAAARGIGRRSGLAALSIAASGQIVGRGAMSGQAGMTLAASGAARGGTALSGTCGVAFVSSGAMLGLAIGSGTAALSIAASGALIGSGALAGTVAITFGGSASFGASRISGTAQLTFGATGVLHGLARASGAVNLSMAAQASLRATGLLKGTAQIMFAASGRFAGTIIGKPAGRTIIAHAESRITRAHAESRRVTGRPA